MQINETQGVNTTCAYCGVGCGVRAQKLAKEGFETIGDENHPSSKGKLCVKGHLLKDTLDLENRLLFPQLDRQRISWENAIATVADKFTEAINSHGPDSVAFYVSGQLLTEDYYVANKLMKGFIGSNNIDTNSRLCMASTVAANKRAFGEDCVPICYDDIEETSLIVIIGSNTADCHPIIWQRILAAQAKSNSSPFLINIDPRQTTVAKKSDLHLPIKSGTDHYLFGGLLKYLIDENYHDQEFINRATKNFSESYKNVEHLSISKISEICSIDPKKISNFFQIYAKANSCLSVYSQGINQSKQGTDNVTSIINCHLATGRIGKVGSGPFSLTGQNNAMGGREVGGLANQAAAHLSLEKIDDRKNLQYFWESKPINPKSGLKAIDLFQKLNEGQIKCLWIMATNPVVSLPNSQNIIRALKKCPFVVLSDCINNTETSQYANLCLPALAWGEKDGMTTNSERIISRQRPFLPHPGEAKPDWWIISEVAKSMGFPKRSFPYTDSYSIFKEFAQLSGYKNNGSRVFDISLLGNMSLSQYESFRPKHWPLNNSNPYGQKRLFTDHKFPTISGRAHFIATHYPLDKFNVFPVHSFVLNNGRNKNHWHTMTRTQKSAFLSSMSPEPLLDIHPSDAEQIGLTDPEHMLIEVSTKKAKIICRPNITKTQRKSNLFWPIHWNHQNSNLTKINDLTQDIVDPISGQPAFKDYLVSMKPYIPNVQGSILLKKSLVFKYPGYWVQSKTKSINKIFFASKSNFKRNRQWIQEFIKKHFPDLKPIWYEHSEQCYQIILVSGTEIVLYGSLNQYKLPTADSNVETLLNKPVHNYMDQVYALAVILTKQG